MRHTGISLSLAPSTGARKKQLSDMPRSWTELNITHSSAVCNVAEGQEVKIHSQKDFSTLICCHLFCKVDTACVCVCICPHTHIYINMYIYIYVYIQFIFFRLKIFFFPAADFHALPWVWQMSWSRCQKLFCERMKPGSKAQRWHGWTQTLQQSSSSRLMCGLFSFKKKKESVFDWLAQPLRRCWQHQRLLALHNDVLWRPMRVIPNLYSQTRIGGSQMRQSGGSSSGRLLPCV